MTDIFSKTLDQLMGKNRNATAKTDFDKEHFTSPEVASFNLGMQIRLGFFLSP